MFREFKLIAELAVSPYKALAGQQKTEWKQLGDNFGGIAETLKSMATKYSTGTVPVGEFVAIQNNAEELQQCWRNMPLSGKSKEVQRWIALLENSIVTAEGTDANYFGFKSVPGPFYSQKEGPVIRRDLGKDPPPPSVQELLEASSAFEAASRIFKSRAG